MVYKVKLSMFVGLVGLAIVLAAVVQPSARAARAENHVVDIPGDRFTPFAMTIKVGDTVTWQNDDTDLHTIVSAPKEAPVPFNLTARSGQSASFTFTVPGLYVYYCNVHASFDSKTAQVAGSEEADDPSEPMEGVIMVLGPNSDAAGSATITADDSDLFSPFAVSVRQGSTVAWQNNDDNGSHSVTLVPAITGMGFDMMMNPGDSAQMTMTAPGLYWYFSTADATYDADNGQVSANDDAANPNEPMMGLIAVFPPVAAGGVSGSTAAGAISNAATSAPATSAASAAPAQPAAPARIAAPNTGQGISPSTHSLEQVVLLVVGAMLTLIGFGMAARELSRARMP